MFKELCLYLWSATRLLPTIAELVRMRDLVTHLCKLVCRKSRDTITLVTSNIGLPRPAKVAVLCRCNRLLIYSVSSRFNNITSSCSVDMESSDDGGVSIPALNFHFQCIQLDSKSRPSALASAMSHRIKVLWRHRGWTSVTSQSVDSPSKITLVRLHGL